MLEELKKTAAALGKREWRPMLSYVAELHEKSTHPPRPPFEHPWEEIGPGYCYGPAFGHWDLIHQVMDVVEDEPEHARMQLLNNLAAQHDDGFLPGSIWLAGDEPRWNTEAGHPPVWPIAVDAYCKQVDNSKLLCLTNY